MHAAVIGRENFSKKNAKTQNRNDEDREINHHGRPVEVGEAESRPKSTNEVGTKKLFTEIVTI